MRAREVFLDSVPHSVERAGVLVGGLWFRLWPAQEPLEDQFVLVSGDVQIGDDIDQGQIDIDDGGPLDAALLLHDHGADEDRGEEKKQDAGDGENLTAN